jgi:hypothetical protein
MALDRFSLLLRYGNGDPEGDDCCTCLCLESGGWFIGWLIRSIVRASMFYMSVFF